MLFRSLEGMAPADPDAPESADAQWERLQERAARMRTGATDAPRDTSTLEVGNEVEVRTNRGWKRVILRADEGERWLVEGIKQDGTPSNRTWRVAKDSVRLVEGQEAGPSAAAERLDELNQELDEALGTRTSEAEDDGLVAERTPYPATEQELANAEALQRAADEGHAFVRDAETGEWIPLARWGSISRVDVYEQQLARVRNVMRNGPIAGYSARS